MALAQISQRSLMSLPSLTTGRGQNVVTKGADLEDRIAHRWHFISNTHCGGINSEFTVKPAN